MTKNSRAFYSVPYVLWLGLFVISPMLLILYQSFFDITGAFTFSNYANYFTSGNYLRMTLNSFLYAFIITLVTFLVSYPTALFLSRTKHKQLWLSLIILPTWINLLLKAYAFIGLFSQSGTVNQFLGFMGISPQQILFTDFSFIFVAAYIELPFMILPIFNSIEELKPVTYRSQRRLGCDKDADFDARHLSVDAERCAQRLSGRLHSVAVVVHADAADRGKPGNYAGNSCGTAFPGYPELGDGLHNRRHPDHQHDRHHVPDERQKEEGQGI
jgi:hypothetical protein